MKIPVITTIMGRGAIPTGHPYYVGNIGIHASYAASKAVDECDVLLAIGTRFNDRITGKTEEFAKEATLIHIDIAPKEVPREVNVSISITADAKRAIEALAKHARFIDCQMWLEKIEAWKGAYPLGMKESSSITPQYILTQINQIFEKGIFVTDVGQNQLWTTQFLELDENKQFLTSGGFGTMGYGLPAAIGAKLGNPQTDVIAICGDGGIQMNIQEMATAVICELPIVICVFNNGYLGNVRQWQQMFYQKKYEKTCLRYRKSCRVRCSSPGKDCPPYTPDLIKLAKAYGAYGIRVTAKEEIMPALQSAKNNLVAPTIIEFVIDPEENVLPITPPGQTSNEMIMEF